MKTTNRKIILFLILTLPILFLSACEDADWDLLEIAFESWAEENNLYSNGKYKPENAVKIAVMDTIGDITNSEKNIQFDGLDVIRDIERADELASDALAFNEPQKMQTALELRPNDWRLQEQNAVLLSVNSQFSLSNEGFGESDNLLKEQIQQGENCVALRKQQLEYRETLLSDNIINCSHIIDCDDDVLTIDLKYTQEELFQIYETGATQFCEK